MNKPIALSLVSFSLALSACGNMPVRLGTPSGNPEVTISGASRKAVASALTNRMLDKGWQIKTSDENHILFCKKVDSMGAMMVFGSGFNAVPEARANYTLVENANGIRVVGNMMMVTNPGSGYEQPTELRGAQDMNGMQKGLDDIASSFRGAAPTSMK